MATMKYIGARYMPKFMGTYDATTAYEALSVVDNGAGTTYVSNKPAPAGTPLSDTEYWTIYGSSSGAILDLQSRMQSVEQSIGDITTDISGITGDITTINGNIDRLDLFGELKGKTIAIFGASNELAVNTQGVNWTDLLSGYLAGYSTIVNKSVAGKKVTEAIGDFILDPDKATYDIVIFCCTKNLFIAQNRNDIGTPTFMSQSALSSAFESLENNRQIGQIFYFASCSPYRDHFKTYPMAIYDGIVKKLAATYGHRTIDMHSWLGCNDYNSYDYTYDGLHYKAEVAPIFAKRALKALLNGGEPFSNYTCLLTGHDVYAYISGIIWSGIDELTDGTNLVSNRFAVDTDLNIKFICGLVNHIGSTVPAGSNIIANVANLLCNKYMVNNVYSTYKVYNNQYSTISMTSRPERISIDQDIENNAEFYLIFGSIENVFAFY